MKDRLDIDKISKALGGERRGNVAAKGGYFGALQVAIEAEARFRIPARGGRATNPSWSERRLLPLAPETLERLGELSRRIRDDRGVSIEPMQLAAILIERAAEKMSAAEAKDLAKELPVANVTRRRRSGG